MLAALFLIAAIVLVERAASNRRGVLLLNQQFGERFLAHEDIYFDEVRGRNIHTPYPPSYALVCAPLSAMPPPLARRIWCVAQLGAVFVLYRILRRRLREHWPDVAAHAPMLLAIALLLTSRFWLRDMKGGGGNLLYGTLTLFGVDRALRDRPLAAGLPFGLALAIKPMFAPFLLLLGLRRRWPGLAASLAGALLFFLLPAVYYGPSAYLGACVAWSEGVLAYVSLQDLHASALVPDGFPPATKAMNQSLRESVHRLLRPPGDSGAFDVHLLLTSPATATLAARLLSILLLLAVAMNAWRARGRRAEWLATLAFLPLCLLLSPITWKAHHAVLLPLLFALATIAIAPGRPRWLVPGLVLYYLACNLASVEVLGDRAGDFLQAISIVAWADIGLIAASVWFTRRSDDAGD